MRLVYKATGNPVHIGDIVDISRDGDEYPEHVRVNYFREPHSLASSGKVTVEPIDIDKSSREYYVQVIGAEWIEREDRAIADGYAPGYVGQGYTRHWIHRETKRALCGSQSPTPNQVSMVSADLRSAIECKRCLRAMATR